MIKILKDLWRYSALPIVIFLIILITFISVLQTKAVQLQSEPIVIKISRSDKIIRTERVEGEEELPELANETDTGDQFTSVRELLEQLLYPEALQELDSIKNDSGENELTYFFLAFIQNKMDNKNEAIINYKEALRLKPNYYEAAINLGLIYLYAGRYDQAGIILESAVSMAGGLKRSKTLTLLGKAYNHSAFYIKAEESLLEAINLNPADLKSRIELGNVYINSEQAEKAENIYREVLLLNQNYGDAYKGLANLRLNEEKYSDAELLLEKAITIAPYYDEGRLMLARILIGSGRNGEAVTHLLWIIDNGEDLTGASFQLGLISYNENNYESAEKHYRNAFSYSGERHLESLNNLALSLKAQGKIDEAQSALTAAIQLDSQYVKAHYNLGLIYLEQDEPQEALNSFKTVTELAKDHEQAWYNIGYIHSQRGAVLASITAYEKTLEINPTYAKCRLNLAVQYKKDGQLDKAEKQYNLVLSINPSYASAWYNLGLLLKGKGDYIEAERAYLQAIELDGENTRYRYSLSLLHSAKGNLPEAARILEEALVISPNEINLRFKLAMIFKEQGSTEGSEKELLTITSLDDLYVQAWIELASIKKDQKNYSAAMDYYDKAIEINHDDNYLHYLKGKTLYKTGDYRAAISQYNEALKTEEDNHWVWYHLGKAQQKSGDESAADESFNRSMALNPAMAKFIVNKLEYTEDSFTLLQSMIDEDRENSSLHIQIAQLYYREELDEKALESLKTVIQLNPEDPKIWIQLGETALDGGNFELAESAYARALRLEPDNGESAYELALLIFRRGDNLEAIKELEKALLLMEKPLPALIKLGEIHYLLKEYTTSVQYYSRAKEIDSNDINLIYNLGKAYYRNRQYEKALEVFTTNIKTRNDHQWGYIWLGRANSRLKEYDEAEKNYKSAQSLNRDFIQSYISLGDLAVLLGKDSSAIEYYEKAITIDPLHESVRNKLTRLRN